MVSSPYLLGWLFAKIWRVKTLILLSGIPGSGKSTWARAYLKDHQNTHIVSSDGIRLRLFGAFQAFHDEKLVWKTFLEDINSHVQDEGDVTVIADSTNLTNAYRRHYFEKTSGFDRHIIVIFDAEFPLCETRNKMRSRDKVVSDEAMKRLEAEWESPSKEVLALYDEVIRISD